MSNTSAGTAIGDAIYEALQSTPVKDYLANEDISSADKSKYIWEQIGIALATYINEHLQTTVTIATADTGLQMYINTVGVPTPTTMPLVPVALSQKGVNTWA